MLNIVCTSKPCDGLFYYSYEYCSHLNEKGIPCGVYYPIPLHLQKAYKDERYKEEDFAVTNQLVKEVISLPMHTELDDDQIKYITETVINFVTK